MKINRTIEAARAQDRATGKSLHVPRRAILGLPLLAAPGLLTGCTVETLLSAGFDQDTVSQLPNPQQTVGTVATALGNGNVMVVASPAGEADGHWVLIQHPNFNDVTSIQGRFSAFRGDGQYMATARLYIPSAAGGVPTLQFEGFNQPLSDLKSFLHLDFLMNGTVRVNHDGNLIFGTYQRGQVFSVQVTFNISASAATATITLLGMASGSLDVAIPSYLLDQARNFGAVRAWMGANFTGAFYVDDLSAIFVTP
ncbi:hypothetical protein WMF18_23550 [Sorangium sp. So ce315]|uniref:hypothetical protein n=1 Tax=Sorangium sp. So ce315 TaxID=3133299 RepID=UPI003F5FF28D